MFKLFEMHHCQLSLTTTITTTTMLQTKVDRYFHHSYQFFRSWCNLHTPLLSLRLFISLTIRTICLNLIGPMWTSLPLIGQKGDNLAFKFHYRTWIRLSKILTGHEFGSKKFLPDKNLALKYHYQTSYQQKKKLK